MAKLVDALPSGGSVRKDVQVRILFWAQKKAPTKNNFGWCFFLEKIFLYCLPKLNIQSC